MADRQNENRSYLGKLPYYEEVMVDKQNLQNQVRAQHHPGPGQYEVAVGFDGIKKTMDQVKHLQNQGLESFGVQVIKNSCNF